MSLKEYKAKRNLKKTLEPKGIAVKGSGKKMFVVQKHHASHLHYDFRLELDGVLKSWAVPKGPSLNPKDKRLAVEVEDHPVDYASFEGEIPEGEYGGGHVIVWDKGEWIPPKDVKDQLKKGRLEFELHGQKLGGEWLLLRTKGYGSGKKNNWLLIKRNDEAADTKHDILKDDESVLTGVNLETLEKDMTGISKKKTKKVVKKVVKAKAQKKSKFLSFTDIGGPELATLADTPPVGDNWIHEIKYDGYRTLYFKNKKSSKLLTRSGLDWSKKYSALQKECDKLKVDSIIFDGEIVWLDEKGRSSFSGLQNSLEEGQSGELVYYVFDALYLNGHDIRHLPLTDRKKLLKQVLDQSDVEKILFSEHWDESGKKVFESACSNHLEGIISKNGESHYSSGRNKNWLKIKCTNLQEFVIGGYTLQENQASLGSILMGAYNDQGKFQYIGRVGTGFTQALGTKLLRDLKKIKSDKSSFEEKSPKAKEIVWVKPKLVGNIEFGAWTDDKILRHAAFKGLREDKKAKDVFLEEIRVKKTSKKKATKKAMKKDAEEAVEDDFALSHPEKILFSESKTTKHDLAVFYESINKWIMPHVKDRPLALLRCPNGEGKTCFFQKHAETDGEGLMSKKIKSKTKKESEEILFIEDKSGLTEMVQMGTLEIHIRGCDKDQIDNPNQIVFDFDPDPGVGFKDVKDAAFALKQFLDKLKLKSFIKASGGKGLHVHVPVAPIYDWEQIKGFSRSVCEQMENENPEKFTTNISKAKRKGKIFLDYLRNGYGATAVSPYSVRAKPHAPVAFPITWEEAKKLKAPDLYTVKSVPKILKKRKDPWAGYFKLKQKIKVLDQFIKLKN